MKALTEEEMQALGMPGPKSRLSITIRTTAILVVGGAAAYGANLINGSFAFFVAILGIPLMLAVFLNDPRRQRNADRLSALDQRRLQSIRAAAVERSRSCRGGAAEYDDDGPDPSRYLVTDGYYDPDLYHERGGYSTYEALDRWNVDYDTYKSNIE